MNNEVIVSLKHINFYYGEQKVLEDINLDIKRGEYLGIVGPNGSGKSTLLKIMLGLLSPSHGHISLFGDDIKVFQKWSKIGYVSQRAVSQIIAVPMTVEEVVALGITSNKRWHDSMTATDKHDVQAALAAVGMESRQKSLLSELSGGQQQRVFIARALVSQPELLILDEPTVGVDSRSQLEFYELLKRLNKDHSLTLILVSHDLEVVAHEVTQVACINRRLVSHGQPKEVLTGTNLEKLYGKNLKFVVHGH